MSEKELIVALAAIAVPVSLFLLAIIWPYLTKARVEKFVREIAPDTVEELALRATMQAYDAVEQRVKAYGAMSNEDRLALAVRYITALLAFYRTGKLSADASEALAESEVWAQHHIEPAPAAPVQPTTITTTTTETSAPVAENWSETIHDGLFRELEATPKGG